MQMRASSGLSVAVLVAVSGLFGVLAALVGGPGL
jgi:hypothetical protein